MSEPIDPALLSLLARQMVTNGHNIKSLYISSVTCDDQASCQSLQAVMDRVEDVTVWELHLGISHTVFRSWGVTALHKLRKGVTETLSGELHVNNEKMPKEEVKKIFDDILREKQGKRSAEDTDVRENEESKKIRGNNAEDDNESESIEGDEDVSMNITAVEETADAVVSDNLEENGDTAVVMDNIIDEICSDEVYEANM